MIAKMLLLCITEHKTMQDRLLSHTTAKLTNELRTLVDKSVSTEIKKSVIPCKRNYNSQLTHYSKVFQVYVRTRLRF